jgi:DNA replication and repair protein RecF
VVIAPDDAELITGDSRVRRTFLDELLSQLDAVYLQDLIVYTRVLQQRNSLLKRFAETNTKDDALLDVLDEQLLKPGEAIFTKRRDFLLEFLPAVKQLYLEIARQPADTEPNSKAVLAEPLQLVYDSELLTASFRELLKAGRQRDLFSQRTNTGIHRDDLEIQLGTQPFKSIASQGQRKSLLFALKLAEMDRLKKEKGFAPLLLLDDVFEKLDEERITNLLRKVCIENEGQVFITDTHEGRLRDHISKLGVPFQLISL